MALVLVAISSLEALQWPGVLLRMDQHFPQWFQFATTLFLFRINKKQRQLQ